MALANDHHQTSSSRSFYENMLQVGSSVGFPHIISPYGFHEYDDNHHHQQDEDALESPNSTTNMVIINNNNNNNNNNNQVFSTSPSSSSSANSSNGFTIHNHNYQPHHEEANSLMNFKSGYESFIHNNNDNNSNNGSLLSFQPDDQVGLGPNYDSDTHPKLGHPINHHPYPIWEGSNNSTSTMNYQDAANDWLYTGEGNTGDPPHLESSPPGRTCLNKRPNMEEENMQTPNKKQCTSKKPSKPKTSSSTKDPQSVAAKNRRERISERLKILQELVPNGSKVDLVTMLEKAIGYVKFLQLQVKVLATDEFWPAAGGKAPDINQVRDAIDAILLSQKSEGTTSTTTK